MNKSQITWISVLFLLVLTFGLLLNLPARQLLRIIEIPPGVGVQGLQGSINRARIDRISFQGVSVTNVKLALNPLCFIKLSACYDIRSEDGALDLDTQINLLTQKIFLLDSKVQIPDTIFEQFPQMIVQPKGEFQLKIHNLVVNELRISDLQATLDWTGAGIKGEEQVLGNYAALIQQETGQISIELSDRDSLLVVNGDAQIEHNGNYELDINLIGKPSLNPSVNSFLGMVSKKTGLNRYSVKRSGKLPPRALSMLNSMVSPG